MNSTRLVLCLAVAASGCRSTDDGGGGGGTTFDARPTGGVVDAAPTATTIKAFLTGTHTMDTMVTFDNVVVVGRVTTRDDGRIWIQDPGGGEKSGMMLFCDFDSPSQMCAMSGEQVDMLEAGDVISVTGKYVRAFNRVDQVTTPVWTKKGTKMTPAALTVDAAMVAKDQEANAQALGNVYVKVAGPVTVANLMADEFKNTSCRPPDMTPDGGVRPDAAPAQTVYDRGFEVAAGGKTLAVGIKFFDTLEYCAPSCSEAFCAMANAIQMTDTFTSVTGVVYFERGNNIDYLEVRPVTNADLPKM